MTDKESSIIEFSHVLETLFPVAAATIDEKLFILETSSGFNRMLGLDDEPLQGSLITDTIWEFVGIEESLSAIVNEEAEPFALENVNRMMPDGTRRYFSFHILNSHGRPKPGTLLLVVEDRSEVGRLQQSLMQERNELRLARQELAKLNEELAQLNRLKSLLLSITAHDLRTPLASIHGYAELLKDILPENDSTAGNLIDVILSQSYRQQQLINALLDFDRVERGQMAIILQNCHLGEIFDEVTTAMFPLSQRFGVALDVTLPEEPLRITADPQKMSQVLYNLLGNALKFTSAGGRIHLIARKEESKLIIDVADDGQGISESEIGSLFEPYYLKDMQVNQDKRSMAGTGLGLFIVKTIVEAHNGQIQVTSRPGEGTTFSLVLPLSGNDGAS